MHIILFYDLVDDYLERRPKTAGKKDSEQLES